MKHGGIEFSSGVAFGGVFAYKQHVTVEFSHEAKIKDVEGCLEGAGKGRRHIRLMTATDIATKKLAVYLSLPVAAAKRID